MSQASSNGLHQLGQMRDRRTRQAPPPRHPKPTLPVEQVDAVSPAESAPAVDRVEVIEMPPVEKPPAVVVPKPLMIKAPKGSVSKIEEPVAPDVDTSTTGQIAVYITPAAVASARRLRRPRVTNAHVALRAVEEMQPQLTELVQARRRGKVREVLPGSSLFPSRSGTAAGTGDIRRVLWAVRLTPAEVAVVDALAAEAGATSRSELVSVAVEAYVARQ